MASINIYLNFNGYCREAFEFYRSVFGGDFTYIGTFGEVPAQDGSQVSEDEKDLIMHVSLPIGATTLMGSDTLSSQGTVTVGNNFSVSIQAESREEADRFFELLSEKGLIVMSMQDTFWNAYFGMITDRFGINWMINHDLR